MCGRYTNTISIAKLAERFGFTVLAEWRSGVYWSG